MANDEYHLHAAACVRLAEQATDPQSKLALLQMAESWRRLARQADKNSHLDLVYETPQRSSEGPGS